MLHQATEFYYAAFLLVFTDYRPKTQDLEDLGDIAGQVNSKLQGVFPRTTKEEKRLSKLLKDAYVHVRYDKGYVITAEELGYLAACVRVLSSLVKALCQGEIARLAATIHG